MADQSDLVPGLHGILRPALAVQNIRTIGLGNPFFNFSSFVRGVEVDKRVGVDPLELRYNTLHGGGRRHVVIRPAMMREHRNTDDEKTNGPNEHTQKLIFHLSTLCDFYPAREQNHMPPVPWCQSHLPSLSKLFRNVPFVTSLEVSPFSFRFSSFLCRRPGPERSPAEPEGRSG